jgi:hypothetical protein
LYLAGGDREGVNVSLLVPLVHKAELSWSEIQFLIDLLLNKQQGSAVGNSEWIEVVEIFVFLVYILCYSTDNYDCYPANHIL